jgi:hypothetical protein
MGISQQRNIHLHELRCHAQIDGSLDFIRQKSFRPRSIITLGCKLKKMVGFTIAIAWSLDDDSARMVRF